MRYSSWLWVVVLILVLVVSTQAIIQAKLFELKVTVSRDRLMNFELSSKVLRQRFKEKLENQDDYRSEVKRNILEASILNESSFKELDTSYLDSVGIAFVNSVRLMSLKPLLQIQRDRELLLLVKYAFYLERSNNLKPAAEKYGYVINELKNNKSNMLAFALLHYGYCQTSLGEKERAINSLQQVVDKFPATHFSQTGVVLLNLLLERKEVSKDIESKTLSNLEKARVYYNNALYNQACKYYDKIKTSVTADKYNWGRCNEEIGKQKKALEIYSDLAKSSSNKKTALLANRRLLLLGNFYNAGEDVAKLAQKNAQKLNDNVALKEIKSAAKEQRNAKVITEVLTGLKNANLENVSGEDVNLESVSLLKDIGKELASNVAIKGELRKELSTEVIRVETDFSEIIALKNNQKKKEKELLALEKQKKLEAAKKIKEEEAAARALVLAQKKRKEEAIRQAERKRLAEEKREIAMRKKENEKEASLKQANQEAVKESLKEKENEDIRISTVCMEAILRDGRTLKLKQINWDDDLLKFKGSVLSSSLRFSALKQIRLSSNKKLKKKNYSIKLGISLDNGQKIKSSYIQILSDENKIKIKGKKYTQGDIENIYCVYSRNSK